MWLDVVSQNQYDLYNLLKDFQTLIAGVVGFSGVIGSIMLTAKYQRKAERGKLEHEARSIRAALVAELRVISKSWATTLDEPLQNPVGDGRLAHLEKSLFDSCYSQLQGKVGILEKEEVEAVVRAYAHYKSANSGLNLISLDGENPYHFVFDDSTSQLVPAILTGPKRVLDESLRILERRLK